jgi:hypothetical protein
MLHGYTQGPIGLARTPRSFATIGLRRLHNRPHAHQLTHLDAVFHSQQPSPVEESEQSFVRPCPLPSGPIDHYCTQTFFSISLVYLLSLLHPPAYFIFLNTLRILPSPSTSPCSTRIHHRITLSQKSAYFLSSTMSKPRVKSYDVLVQGLNFDAELLDVNVHMDRHRLGLIDRYTLVALDVLLGYQKRYASLSLPFTSLSQMIGCNLKGLDTRQSVRAVLLAFQTAQHAVHKTWTSHPASTKPTKSTSPPLTPQFMVLECRRGSRHIRHVIASNTKSPPLSPPCGPTPPNEL